MALDIGPNTVAAFAAKFQTAKLVLFAGSVGAAENPAFAKGTLELARALAQTNAFSVVVGEGTAAVTLSAGDDVASRLGLVSTLGGAALDLIEGRRLPGLEALRGGAT